MKIIVEYKHKHQTEQHYIMNFDEQIDVQNRDQSNGDKELYKLFHQWNIEKKMCNNFDDFLFPFTNDSLMGLK